MVEAFLDEVSLFKAAVVECCEWTLYTLSLTRRFLLLLQMDTTVCYIKPGWHAACQGHDGLYFPPPLYLVYTLLLYHQPLVPPLTPLRFVACQLLFHILTSFMEIDIMIIVMLLC